MKVVLAEKPSVARELAAFLGARDRHDGYFEGGGYQVTWALGHLVSLKEPDEYDPSLKKWQIATLPFVPESFQLKVIGDKRSRKQFDIIKRLFRSASELICATDAGREGELIFRYILTLTGCRKPFSRLWLNSLTHAAIQTAFKQLRPGSDYDRLYAAAKCRSEADWIVGLNATRNFTVRFGSDGILWSAGRVQTPVLAMIANRDDEIRTFKPEPFWELLTRYRDVVFRCAGGRFVKQDEAQSALASVQGHDLVIQNVNTKRERSLPPLLYDLTDLQRDMNRRYGMSADATLKTAQSLYEKKVITYPRTDSRYLTRDMQRDIPNVLKQLQSIKADALRPLNLDRLNFNARIVNDSKVTDHHAIIPTAAKAGSLPPAASKVYDAIVTRLIAVFYPPCLKDVTTVDANSNSVRFRARGVQLVDPGWTALYPRKPSAKSSNDEDAEQDLPAFTPGERGPHEPSIKQGETKPPKHFTENTLLSAMETAGKFVDDEELKEALKERGLGTPATRASIIETLLKRDYISRSGKTLAATDLGRYLIAVIQNRDLKSPELTGQWESKLRQIEAGRLDARQFMSEIVEYTNQIIHGSDGVTVDDSKFGDCPQCGRPIIEGNRGYGCSGWRDGCGFVLWKKFHDYEFTVQEIRTLLQIRLLEPPPSIGITHNRLLSISASGAVVEIPKPEKQSHESRFGKSKSKFQRGKFQRGKFQRGKSGGSEKAGTKSAAANRALGPCPLCGGEVVEQPKSFSCSQWQQGCKLVIWKSIAGKTIGIRAAKTLLKTGQTSLLKGFKSKAGKKFDAKLKLIDGAVKFDFD